MRCCPDPTILSQLQLRPQVPLTLMPSVCTLISAGASRASQTITNPSHSLSRVSIAALQHGNVASICIGHLNKHVSITLYSVTLCDYLYIIMIFMLSCNLYVFFFFFLSFKCKIKIKKIINRKYIHRTKKKTKQIL